MNELPFHDRLFWAIGAGVVSAFLTLIGVAVFFLLRHMLHTTIFAFQCWRAPFPPPAERIESQHKLQEKLSICDLGRLWWYCFWRAPHEASRGSVTIYWPGKRPNAKPRRVKAL